MKLIQAKRGIAVITATAFLAISAAPANAAAPVYVEAVATSATLTPIASAGDLALLRMAIHYELLPTTNGAQLTQLQLVAQRQVAWFQVHS